MSKSRSPTRTYCCQQMTRWVSNPAGANAPPEPKIIEEEDFPEITRMTTINTSLAENDNVLIHHDPYDDFGIVGRGNWGGHYVGIAFCPWCGSKLDTSVKLVGKMIPEFAGQFEAFDDRECSLEQMCGSGPAGVNLADYAEEADIQITDEMSTIEILIKLQGKYRTGSRYSNYPGRAEVDFDKEWPPKQLTVIAQFCAEHGRANPDLALWKLLRAADQPAVWALALLDIAAREIPDFRDIFSNYVMIVNQLSSSKPHR